VAGAVTVAPKISKAEKNMSGAEKHYTAYIYGMADI
jgi:hypothetical protein